MTDAAPELAPKQHREIDKQPYEVDVDPATILAAARKDRTESHEDLLLRLERLEKFKTIEDAESWLASVVVQFEPNVDKNGDPAFMFHGEEVPRWRSFYERGIAKANYTDDNGLAVNRLSVEDALKHVYAVTWTSGETTLMRTTNPHSTEHRYGEGFRFIRRWENNKAKSSELVPYGGTHPDERSQDELELEFIKGVTGFRVALYTALSNTEELDRLSLRLDRQIIHSKVGHARYLEDLRNESKENSLGRRALRFLRRK